VLSSVDQRAGAGVSRVRRLLSRALLVAGGALAGTAAAWALSAAPASAQAAGLDLGDEGAVAAVTRVVADREPVGEAVAPVREAVRGLDAALPARRAADAAPPELDRIAEGLRGAFGQAGAGLNPGAATLDPRPTGLASSGLLRSTAPAGRAAEARPAETAPTAEAVPAVDPVVTGAVVVRGPFGKLSESWAASPAPLPADALDPGPAGPAGPPFAPATPPFGVPAHCTCAGDGPGSVGGGTGPFTGVSADGTDTAVARALLPATERNTVAPGKQPGTTPD